MKFPYLFYIAKWYYYDDYKEICRKTKKYHIFLLVFALVIYSNLVFNHYSNEIPQQKHVYRHCVLVAVDKNIQFRVINVRSNNEDENVYEV